MSSDAHNVPGEPANAAGELVLPKPPPATTEHEYEDLTDLVRRVEQGDQRGMEELYQVLSKGIRSCLVRRLNNWDVEDKVHEVFVDVVSA